MSTRFTLTPAGARSIGDLIRRINVANPQGSSFVNPVSQFSAVLTNGNESVTVSFQIASLTGLNALTILRNGSPDAGSATVIATFPASALSVGQSITYQDVAPPLGDNFWYWIQSMPSAAGATPVTQGPVSLSGLQSAPQQPPPLSGCDASIGAGSNGKQTIYVEFGAPTGGSFGGCLVQISGYDYQADYVDIAESESSPFSFELNQTGEEILLLFFPVNGDGVPGSTASDGAGFTLNGEETAPCMPWGLMPTALSTGVQLQWQGNIEPDIDEYKIYRLTNWQTWLNEGEGLFSNATLIGTLANPGVGTACEYLDATGLQGSNMWFVTAHNPAGESVANFCTLPQVSTSATLPPNSQNVSNNATVDSVDAGTSATVRIYGPGGPGYAWTETYGWGTETYPAGQVTGLAYSTWFYIAFDGESFHAVTSLDTIMADNFLYIGTVETVASGGTGGTSGGGGGLLAQDYSYYGH